MKTSELTGIALDWAVTKCEGYNHDVTPESEWGMWGWATDWAQGGPIIEREGIQLSTTFASELTDCPTWGAFLDDGRDYVESMYGGPTPLIAAMRCYVASILGADVEIPEELMESSHV